MVFEGAGGSARGVIASGFWQIRVDPDFALLTFAVSCLDATPEEAFAETRRRLTSVHGVLGKALPSRDVQVSRLSLQREMQFKNGRQEMAGYRARVSFVVRVENLDLLEPLLPAVIAAGANEIANVTFHKKKIRELRSEARAQAVAMAKAKAAALCQAAGVSVGRVLYIEDGNLRPRMEETERSHYVAAPPDDDEEVGARGPLAPGTVTISATVTIRCAILPGPGAPQ